MNQSPLFLEDRTKYLILLNGKLKPAWLMGEKFVLADSSGGVFVEGAEVVERLGSEKELFK